MQQKLNSVQYHQRRPIRLSWDRSLGGAEATDISAILLLTLLFYCLSGCWYQVSATSSTRFQVSGTSGTIPLKLLIPGISYFQVPLGGSQVSHSSYQVSSCSLMFLIHCLPESKAADTCYQLLQVSFQVPACIPASPKRLLTCWLALTALPLWSRFPPLFYCHALNWSQILKSSWFFLPVWSTLCICL